MSLLKVFSFAYILKKKKQRIGTSSDGWGAKGKEIILSAYSLSTYILGSEKSLLALQTCRKGFGWQRHLSAYQ